MLAEFFVARRGGILKDDGLYGLRCAIVDMNELFNCKKVHCSEYRARSKGERLALVRSGLAGRNRRP